MKIPAFIKNNLLLKMTSLNSAVVVVRLLISLVIQRLLAQLVGPSGIAKIGNLRSVMAMLMSFSTLGIFNGIVKYVSEHKEDHKELQKVFSTAFVFVFVACLFTSLSLFFGASYFSEITFGSLDFVFLFKILAIVVPAIALQRVF
ncbi:MAG: oligosaccharide flippase family protein, partial [Flavobacteriaceae bacterium]|nr:oligosaccharide flippase family protein [Flavobacteriaceae bacterium]